MSAGRNQASYLNSGGSVPSGLCYSFVFSLLKSNVSRITCINCGVYLGLSMSENVVRNGSTSDLLLHSCEDDAKNNTDRHV